LFWTSLSRDIFNFYINHCRSHGSCSFITKILWNMGFDQMSSCIWFTSLSNKLKCILIYFFIFVATWSVHLRICPDLFSCLPLIAKTGRHPSTQHSAFEPAHAGGGRSELGQAVCWTQARKWESGPRKAETRRPKIVGKSLISSSKFFFPQLQIKG
jgi:hypothetical protein